MKKAAKVFIIIGIVLTFWCIFPIIFGCLALKKMKTATTRAEMTKWGVLCILFVSVLGGIFLLCTKDSDYAENAAVAQ